MINQEQQQLSFNAYLQNLGEPTLLTLVRHYLGTEPKRKDKRELSQALLYFIKLEETQTKVVALLDEQDILSLQAIDFIQQQSLLKEQVKKQQLSYLRGLLYPITRLNMEVIIQNLTDRLLIYFNSEDKLYHLNPYWYKLLLSAFPKHKLLTFSFPQTSTYAPLPLITLSTIQAVLVISQTTDNYKSWQESVLQHLKHHFSTQFLEDLIHALISDAIITDQHNTINLSKIHTLEQLPDHQALAYFHALLCHYQTPSLEFDALYFLISNIFIHSSHVTNTETLIRLYTLNALNLKSLNVETLIQKLSQLQLIKRSEDQADLYHLASHPSIVKPFNLRIEGDLSYFYPIEYPISTVLLMCSTLSHYDTYSQYILTKDQVTHAITKGVAKQDIHHFFATQCDPASNNIQQTLEYWLTTSSALLLYKETVLHVQAPFLHLLTHQEFLDGFVETQISDDVCLLKESIKHQDLIQFLKQHGIQAPVHYVTPITLKPTIPNTFSPVAFTLTSYLYPSLPQTMDETTTALNPSSLSRHQQVFIQRKLILDPLQLAWLKPFRQCASGLDFQAKLRLLDLAIKEKQDLLLTITRPDNDEYTMHLKPVHFDKKETKQLKAYDYQRTQLISLPTNIILHIEVVNRYFIKLMH